MIIQTPNCLAAAENDLAVGLYHLHVNFRKYIVLQSNSVWSIENNYVGTIFHLYYDKSLSSKCLLMSQLSERIQKPLKDLLEIF